MGEPSRRFDGSRALVVDDDAAIVHLLRRFLESDGFDVEVAASGPEGLEALQRRPVELVITDLSMPAMTGIEMIREARARGSNAAFVVLTAVGSVPAAVEAMKTGAFEFLEKPVRFDHLRKVVAAAVDHRRQSAVQVQTGDVLSERPVPGASSAPGFPSSPAAGPPPLPPGDTGRCPAQQIGRYEVLGLIGRGGMGEVYRCRDPLIGRVVAVKVLRVSTERPERSAELVARFQREAAAAGTLQHPGIVAVHDLGRDPQLGLWFIVLELVVGRAFDVVLEQRKRLPPAEAVSIGFQVADALAFAHARGVVHRDVKPANVLVRDDGTTKLLDFGLAAMQGRDLTNAGQVLGSPSYMAPERIRGRPGDATVDQFSLGVLLYESLVGRNPFDGETHEARMVAVLESRPERADRARRGVPPALGELIDRLMAKKPGERFARSDEVVVELGRIGATLGLALERYDGEAGGGGR